MSSNPLTTILNEEEDLDTVFDQVFPARTVWYNIGLGLKLNPNTLVAIDEDCPGSSNKALRKMLKLWFEVKEPTWKKLCDCLRKSTVMRNVLADNIQGYVIEQGAQKASAKSTRSKAKSKKSEAQPSTSTEETARSGRKRKSDPTASSPKRAKVVKPGKIEGDRVLMKIGREVGDKWMDVGLALGMEFMDLTSRVENDPKVHNDRKPMYMLQEWKKKAGDSFTYATLASALEEVGLHTCAQTHCYE